MAQDLQNEPEFLRLTSLCRRFECDRKTMEKLLAHLQQAYHIETMSWNGQARVNYHQFRRAVVNQALQFS